ncbi:MAG: 4-phosphoerythronate dehydrogenase [Paludibacteraceae bacterium]
MKIIIDKNIPFIRGVFENVAETLYLSAKEMTPQTVCDADALIIRTRTRCNQSLLDGSSVKFIATATIGYDHIDTEYCEKNNIRWTNAPGCNALSVTQYMASVFSYLIKKQGFNLSGKTLGIVGVGEVGSRVAQLGKYFGMKVMLNDPPRARNEGAGNFVSLDDIAKHADIITFHPFLNMDGIDKTFHLANDTFFQSLKKNPVIVNASRGEVVETNALVKAIEHKMVDAVVLDCWEFEPNIHLDLMKKCAIATPHIAGYSADGKANATTQSVRSVSHFFQLGLENWEPSGIPNPTYTKIDSTNTIDFFLESYNIEKDSNTLKKSPETFENQRSDYPVRREPKYYRELIQAELLETLENDYKVFFE